MTETLTFDADLDAITARAEAAPPGPWDTEEPGPYVQGVWALDPEGRRFDVARWMEPAVARFIAHARTDVPALVAEVERLREEKSRRLGSLIIDAYRVDL